MNSRVLQNVVEDGAKGYSRGVWPGDQLQRRESYPIVSKKNEEAAPETDTYVNQQPTENLANIDLLALSVFR